MDVPLVISRRLKELGLEQKDLAIAAQVTESYISQLLARKKAPPAPDRTDIYEKIGKFLKLRSGELAKLADLQRKEALRKKVADPPRPLFREVRELILLKCDPRKRKQIRLIFEKEPFGEVERLITQKILDVAKRVAKEELESENWLRLVARLSQRSYEQMRVMILEFLETKTEPADEPEPGLEEFLKDAALSADATKDEIDFLKRLKFKRRRPAPLYYYRELQNLRDPLHFRHVPDETSDLTRGK